MRKSLAFAAILVGLFVSIYLTWAYTSPSHKLVCLGTGCDVVRSSRFAYPFGIPLPIFGLVFYAVLTALGLAEPHVPRRSAGIWRAIAVLSGAGVLFSAWLTYLEAYVIHGWCAWCVVQAIAVTVAFVLALTVKRSTPRAATDGTLPSLSTTQNASSWRSRYAILAAAVVIGIPGFVLATRQHEAATQQQKAALPADAGQLVRPDSHWTGNPNAKLTIVEFGDFQCPSCGVAERTNRAIRDQFGNQVKFVFREFPLERIHAFAVGAAKAAECAGQQDKFWPMAEALYTNQTKLKPADIQQYSADLGLDQQKFAACLDDPATTARIRTDMADGQALDVRATPTFFLNGKKTEGALDMMQVAAALSAANAQPSVENEPAGTSPAPAQPGKQAKPTSTVSAESKLSYRDTPHNSGGPTVLVKGGDAKAPSTAPNPLIASGSGAFGAFSSGTGCGINPEPDPPMIHTSQARELFEKKSATFVDVRDADVSAKGRIPNSLNIPMDQLKRRLPELAKDKSFVLYEGGGSPGDPCALSKSAARIMIGSGFKQVHVFQEGLSGWRKDGLPVAQ